ncbi:MAG TPA: hypothetical protein VIQ03_00545 [Gammaproteobacteria bacterium]
MKTMRTIKYVVCFSVLVPVILLGGCGNLAIVQPTDSQLVVGSSAAGSTVVEVPIVADFTASTSARNIVLDGNLNITTAPAAGFITTTGAGQNGWDQMRGKYLLESGSHTLTVSAEYLDWARTRQSLSKTVQFTVVSQNLHDLWANVTSSVETFNGSSPVDFAVYIHNRGPMPANNISFSFYTNLPAGMSALNINSGFSCRGISNFGQALHAECSGGNINGNQSAYMTVTIRPTSILPAGTPFTLYGYLDHPNASILESDETNNTFNKAVIVGP